MRTPRAWWAPVVLLLAPVFGHAPVHRDLLDYFLPLRLATFDALLRGVPPWLNPLNGCGEAWFANPQTGVLYPPHWVWAVLPPAWALTVEVAFHLALLAAGIGLLARRAGAGPVGVVAAEVASWAAPPVLATVGVVNNLAALAWAPWIVAASGTPGRWQVVATALATAAGWLAGEPTVWACALLLAVAASPVRHRAIAGVALGIAVVAVQLVPFSWWVLDGDRGPATATLALSGALEPAQWWGVLLPAATRTTATGMVWTESVFLGAPLLVCIALGAQRRPLVAASATALALLATLPAIGGERLYVLLTQGLIRYPSRFAILATVVALPLLALGVEMWRQGAGRALAAALAALALVGCAASPSTWHLVAAGAPAAVLLLAAVLPTRRPLRDLALASGLAGAAIAGWPLLDLQRWPAVESRSPAWPGSDGSGRMYAPPPPVGATAWLVQGLEPRRLWPTGFLNLLDHSALVRTDAPVADRRVMQHLTHLDSGPDNRWWLDTAGARWLVVAAASELPGLEEVDRRAGLIRYRNVRALPVVAVGADAPDPAREWKGAGAVVSFAMPPAAVRACVVLDRPAHLWLGIAPMRGWRWSLDGGPVELRPGPGIVQSLPIGPGAHRIEGRYRPPGIVPGGVLSAAAILTLVCLGWRGTSRRRKTLARPSQTTTQGGAGGGTRTRTT